MILVGCLYYNFRQCLKQNSRLVLIFYKIPWQTLKIRFYSLILVKKIFKNLRLQAQDVQRKKRMDKKNDWTDNFETCVGWMNQNLNKKIKSQPGTTHYFVLCCSRNIHSTCLANPSISGYMEAELIPKLCRRLLHSGKHLLSTLILNSLSLQSLLCSNGTNFFSEFDL